MVSLLKSPKEVFLLVIPVIIHPPTGEPVLTYALLDNCSQSTLLREDMAQKLNLRGKSDILNIGTIKDKAEGIPVESISLEISSRDKKFRTTIEEVSVVPTSRLNMPGRPRLADIHDPDLYTHLDEVDIDPISSESITMLIGANVPDAVLTLDVRRGSNNQPLAVKTVFGWTLFGPAATTPSLPSVSNISSLFTSRVPPQHISATVSCLWEDKLKPDLSPGVDAERSDERLLELVEGFWNQEVGPITPGTDVAPSREDEEASKKLDDETVLINGHYQVPMLWKTDSAYLPNNKEVALKRFKFLRAKLRKDPALYAKYKETFEKYVTKGYARKMSDAEAAHTTDRTWYLPHHPVINPNKPGKVRIVKDAAAQYKGKGLNTSLNSGPDLLRSLMGRLLRFRTGKIAVVADVEEMFHQVRVSREDADSLRFLWTDDIFSNNTYTMQMLAHIFGAKCSPTCANYALQQSARDNQTNFDPLTVETVLKSFYMDDLLKSVNSVEVAQNLVKELVDILKLGGFRLTKFMSNCEELLKSLPPSEVSPKVTFDLGGDQTQRALGVLWDLATDKFKFSVNLPDAPETKRGILRVTCSIFDPPGFVLPFVLRPKLLLREQWRLEVAWDENIDDGSRTIWRNWREMANFLSELEIDRCFNLHDSPIVDVQLHLFADASELAYGTVAYLRFSYKDGVIACAFVMAKSKLAPIKTISLPRLELNAAVTSVRLFTNIILDIDFPVESVFFWSDSTLVHQYINNTAHRFQTFVANRVTEIVGKSAPRQWGHVPGSINPADVLTRGVEDPRELMVCDSYGNSWWGGPGFLWKPPDHWPNANVSPLAEDDPEIKRKPVLVALGFAERHNVIDLTRFSTWTKLTRVTGWVLRFVDNTRAKRRARTSGELTSDEIDTSENLIVKLVQRDSFNDEINTLASKGTLPINHKLSPLSPYVDDDGALRVGGRLRNARIPAAAKNQLILPKDHSVTRLLVVHDHLENGHVGPEHVLANLREKYWIVNGRILIRNLLRRCLLCKIKRARRRHPYMADLPTGRLACDEPPFTNCGVDLFGPLYIKQGRKRLKRWGVLYTCLTVRCVHLEVVESLETDDFINSLRRFINRRGSPKVMYSDQGTNFVGATSELKEAIKSMDEVKITQFATSRQIIWKFNPPAAPHMGGAWERLVRSTKEVLSALMTDKVLTDQQLYTLLTEVERILNSRPLTHISDHIDDLEALTPNHILLGLHRRWSFICEIDERDTFSRKKYRQVLAIAAEFWKRWRREYLPKLTTRSKWRQHTENIKEGQLVLLVDDEDSRKTWSLARITRVIPGDDGVVRVVEVKTKNGLYTRPVAKVCCLEDDISTEVPQGEEYVATP